MIIINLKNYNEERYRFAILHNLRFMYMHNTDRNQEILAKFEFRDIMEFLEGLNE